MNPTVISYRAVHRIGKIITGATLYISLCYMAWNFMA
jgi:hypothetical protein